MSLISLTPTASGFRIRSEVEHGSYPLGVAITEDQIAKVTLQPQESRGDWKCTTHPVRRVPP